MSENNNKRTSVHERLYVQTTAASAPKLARPGEAASAKRPVSMSTKSKDEAQGKIIYLLSYDEKYPEKEKLTLTENMKKDGSRPRHDLKRKAESMGVSRGLKTIIGPTGKIICNTGKMESLDLDAVRTGNCYLVLNSGQYGIVKGTDVFKEKVEYLRQIQDEGSSLTFSPSSPLPTSPKLSLSPTSRSSISSRSSGSSHSPNPRSPTSQTESVDIGTRLSQQTTLASEGRFDFPTDGTKSRHGSKPVKPVVTPLSKDEPQAKTIYLLDYDEKSAERQTLVLRENAKKDGSRPRHDIKKMAEAMGVGAGSKVLVNARGKFVANTSKIENLDLSKLETNHCFWAIQSALYSVVKDTPEFQEKVEYLAASQEEHLENYRKKHERKESSAQRSSAE